MLIAPDTSVHYKPIDSLGRQVKAFAVYAFPKGVVPDSDNAAYLMKLFPGSTELALNDQFFSLYPAQQIGISVIDRNNNESEMVMVR